MQTLFLYRAALLTMSTVTWYGAPDSQSEGILLEDRNAGHDYSGVLVGTQTSTALP